MYKKQYFFFVIAFAFISSFLNGVVCTTVQVAGTVHGHTIKEQNPITMVEDTTTIKQKAVIKVKKQMSLSKQAKLNKLNYLKFAALVNYELETRKQYVLLILCFLWYTSGVVSGVLDIQTEKKIKRRNLLDLSLSNDEIKALDSINNKFKASKINSPILYETPQNHGDTDNCLLLMLYKNPNSQNKNFSVRFAKSCFYLFFFLNLISLIVIIIKGLISLPSKTFFYQYPSYNNCLSSKTLLSLNKSVSDSQKKYFGKDGNELDKALHFRQLLKRFAREENKDTFKSWGVDFVKWFVSIFRLKQTRKHLNDIRTEISLFKDQEDVTTVMIENSRILDKMIENYNHSNFDFFLYSYPLQNFAQIFLKFLFISRHIENLSEILSNLFFLINLISFNLFVRMDNKKRKKNFFKHIDQFNNFV